MWDRDRIIDVFVSSGLKDKHAAIPHDTVRRLIFVGARKAEYEALSASYLLLV